MNNRIKNICILTILTLFLLMIKLIPVTCLFWKVTGIYCPTCGMTRAFKSLLSFDIMNAFWYHPLFPLVSLFPYIFVKMNKRLIFIVGGIFIITWIIRLILFFPDESPMVPNTSTYLYKVFINIKGMID